MIEPSLRRTSRRELMAWSKTDMVKAAERSAWLDNPDVIQAAPQIHPAESEILTSTTNDIQERDNSLAALLCGAGVNRMRKAVGLSQKPTPAGKPRDMPTETRQHGR